MNRSFSHLACFALLAIPAAALAQPSIPEEAEARAMLERAASALKADKARTIEQLNGGYGVGPFKVQTLYVFCANTEGRFTAHPKLVEVNLRGGKLQDVKDKTGREIGKEMMAKAKEGAISSFTYMYDRPGSQGLVQKKNLMTKVDDQLCGIAFYTR